MVLFISHDGAINRCRYTECMKGLMSIFCCLLPSLQPLDGAADLRDPLTLKRIISVNCAMNG